MYLQKYLKNENKVMKNLVFAIDKYQSKAKNVVPDQKQNLCPQFYGQSTLSIYSKTASISIKYARFKNSTARVVKTEFVEGVAFFFG